MNHEQFRQARYFPELDGLRALSILLVVTIHTTDSLWKPLKGNVGVTIFFVISGFIITTLLVRERDERGHVRLGAFYARRAFRILPTYYVVLGAYILLVGILKWQPGAEELWRALPYFATYQNDLANSNSGFSITWSLAIEEKFYLIWPLFFLPMITSRIRLRAAALLAVAVAPFALAAASSRPGMVGWAYPAIYAPIIFGCIVALLMHTAKLYSAVRPLTRSLPVTLLLVAAVADQVLIEHQESNVHLVYALLVALALPACLTGPEWLRRVLRSRVLVYIGTRSYALYLVHRMGKGVIDRVIAPGEGVPQQILRFVLITVLGLLGAEVIRMLVEQPMIRLGRRLTSRDRSGRHAAALEPTVDRPDYEGSAVDESATERPAEPRPAGDPISSGAEIRAAVHPDES